MSSFKTLKFCLIVWNLITMALAIVVYSIGCAVSSIKPNEALGGLIVCFSGVIFLVSLIGTLGAFIKNIWLIVYTVSVFVVIILLEIICTSIFWLSEVIKKKYGGGAGFFDRKCISPQRSSTCDVLLVMLTSIAVLLIVAQCVTIHFSLKFVDEMLKLSPSKSEEIV